MNIEKMLEMQTQVDAKIMEKVEIDKPLLQNNLKLALQVEIAEFANELQSFKHWKHNKVIDDAKVKDELADCIAFALALINHYDIGNLNAELMLNTSEAESENKDSEITYSLLESLRISSDIWGQDDVVNILLILLNLAKNTLHFTEEEIEEAYMAKAKINMERQEEGY
ncbi:hypothetical protein HBP98_00930 [Listeria booriae]|uniref:dUTPase n=1 Tax=Listeria booriae TaxID=1552123 RepID=A0A7X1DPQ2_9LIST|nr:dUTP diphosphatase [Listeria booriae]MBC2370557.1 hypothetical protein [Listeria booriae]